MDAAQADRLAPAEDAHGAGEGALDDALRLSEGVNDGCACEPVGCE